MNTLKTTGERQHRIIKNIIDKHLGDHNLARWEMDSLVDELYNTISAFPEFKNTRVHSSSEGAD